MAFTLAPSTKRGKVRLLVGDTDTATVANQIFTDAEIDAFLSLENNAVYPAAAAACQSVAASAAKSAIAWRAMGSELSVDKKEVPAAYRELANQYRERATGEMAGPVEEIDSMDYEVGPFGDTGTSEFVGDTTIT